MESQVRFEVRNSHSLSQEHASTEEIHYGFDSQRKNTICLRGIYCSRDRHIIRQQVEAVESRPLYKTPKPIHAKISVVSTLGSAGAQKTYSSRSHCFASRSSLGPQMQ